MKWLINQNQLLKGLEDDGQAGDNCENIKIMDSKQVSDKIKERQFGNVRKRNNSWSESKRNSVQHEKRNSSNESTEKRNNSSGQEEVIKNYNKQNEKKSSYLQVKDKRNNNSKDLDWSNNNFTNQQSKRKFSDGSEKILLK